MHMHATPQNMHLDHMQGNVVTDVRDFLVEVTAPLLKAGVARERILWDPGFGFGKTLDHNLALLRNLEVFGEAGYPVFVGMSRKTMLGAITGRDVNERVFAGAAAALLAVQRGARIVRTHDVGATRDVLRVWAAVEADSHAGFAAKC